jgi:hypothetical protein
MTYRYHPPSFAKATNPTLIATDGTAEGTATYQIINFPLCLKANS